MSEKETAPDRSEAAPVVRPHRSDLDYALVAATGKQIPGGCDQCHDPYQSVRQDSGGWVITVHHDDGCPVLIRHRRGRA